MKSRLKLGSFSIPGIPFTFFTKNNLILGNRKWFRRIQHTPDRVTRHGTVHLQRFTAYTPFQSRQRSLYRLLDMIVSYSFEFGLVERSTQRFNCPGTGEVSVAPLGQPAWSGATPRGGLGCLCQGGAQYTNGMDS